MAGQPGSKTNICTSSSSTSQNLSLGKITTLFLLQLLVIFPSQACPTECTCQGTAVVCASTDISRVPLSLSRDTTLLTIMGSRDSPFSLQRLSRTDFKNIPNLIHLKISFTQLKTIDEDALFDLVNVKRVDFANNHLSSLLPNTFSGLRELTFVSLSGNPGLDMSDRMFWNLPNLQELYMSGIDLPEVHSVMFYGLNSLKKLDLSSNSLESFSPEVLTSMPSLWSLDLSYNQLVSLDQKLEPFFTKFKHVQLGGNRWQCNCLLKWLKNYPAFLSLPLSDLVVCAGPPVLQFQHLVEVDSNLLTCESPVISKCPDSVMVQVGETLSLRCLVTGDPFPKIKWTFADGTRLEGSTDPDVPLEDRANINVSNIPLNYNGTLTLAAFNAFGSRIKRLIVRVYIVTTSTTTTTTIITPTAETPMIGKTTVTRDPIPARGKVFTTPKAEARYSEPSWVSGPKPQVPSTAANDNGPLVAAASAVSGAALVVAAVLSAGFFTGYKIYKKWSTKSNAKVGPMDVEMNNRQEAKSASKQDLPVKVST